MESLPKELVSFPLGNKGVEGESIRQWHCCDFRTLQGQYLMIVYTLGLKLSGLNIKDVSFVKDQTNVICISKNNSYTNCDSSVKRYLLVSIEFFLLSLL